MAFRARAICPCFWARHRISCMAISQQADHSKAMLTEIYIEALLVDEELADLVWEAWDAGYLGDDDACVTWLLIAIHRIVF